jgi:uncharacterized membrane protein
MQGKKVDVRDIAEIVIGSLVLAFPVAVTEEVWNLGAELSLGRTLVIWLSSLVFVSFFVQTAYRHDFSFASQKQLLARVGTVYGLTLLLSAAVLLAVDRLPLLTETMVAFKRAIIVAFPASFAATVVDSIGDSPAG